MSIRTERVAATIRQALGDYLSRGTPEYLDGMVTITSVKISADLSLAKVYVSFWKSRTDPDILAKRMNDNQGDFRSVLANKLRMRKVPALRFFRDDTLDEAEQIDDLIKRVREEDDRIAALRGETPGADRARDFDLPKGHPGSSDEGEDHEMDGEDE